MRDRRTGTIEWMPVCDDCRKADETVLLLGPKEHPCTRCGRQTRRAVREVR